MTTPTYLSDATQRTLDTEVTNVQRGDDGIVEVRCKDTVFHPLGGGQPADAGSITAGARVLAVIDVRQDPDGSIWHTLDTTDQLDVGSHASMEIDWDRRYRLMRTHTAAHLLCAIAATHYGAKVTGCEMTEMHGRVDFDGLPGGIAAELTDLLNAAVATASEVSLSFLEPGEAANDPDLVRTKTNRVPAHVTAVRVVTIGDIDRQADGGTHVTRTDEIGGITVTKLEAKGKGNRRVRFVLDD
jgi:misacylated tRNA(Ala) deacylase